MKKRPLPYQSEERKYAVLDFLKYLEKLDCNSPILTRYIILNSIFLKINHLKYIHTPLKRKRYFCFIFSGAFQVFVKEKIEPVTIDLLTSKSIFKMTNTDHYVQALSNVSCILLPYDELMEFSKLDVSICKFTDTVSDLELKRFGLANIVTHIKP